MHPLIVLGLLAVCAFVQNAAFTAVSRSRNSADVRYHAWCSIWSNGVWFLTQLLIWTSVWRAIEHGEWSLIAAAAVVYVAATTGGSCWMMARMLKSEKGKRRVGASNIETVVPTFGSIK